MKKVANSPLYDTIFFYFRAFHKNNYYFNFYQGVPPRFASPRLATADLEPKTDPERSEGARPEENDDYYFYLYKKKETYHSD